MNRRLTVGKTYSFKNSAIETDNGEYFGTFLHGNKRYYLFETLDDFTSNFGTSYNKMQENPNNHLKALKLIYDRYPNKRDIPGNARYCSRLMEDILLGTTTKDWLKEQLNYSYE